MGKTKLALLQFRIGSMILLVLFVALMMVGWRIWQKRQYCLTEYLRYKAAAAANIASAQVERNMAEKLRLFISQMQEDPNFVAPYRKTIRGHILTRDETVEAMNHELQQRKSGEVAFQSLAEANEILASLYMNIANHPWLSMPQLK